MTVTERRPVDPEDRESLPSVREYLLTDRGEPPAFFLERSTQDLGNDLVPKARFIAQDWHDLEVENLWKRVWQAACRENDIPEVGDQIVYDVVGQSVIIVRVAPDDIRAYHNTCRHRGNRLVEESNTADVIQCSFHGWTWNLDGSLNRIPCRWDFPEARDQDYGLPGCKVARWNGWVFINLDTDAGPLEDYLGDAVRTQLETWPTQHMWKAAHVGKVLPCNWKVALEAFVEVYHSFRVHPSSVFFAGDCNSQYDFYGPHARMLTPLGVPSPFLGDDVDPQSIVDAMLGDAGLGGAVESMFGEQTSLQLPELQPGDNPRSVLADAVLAAFKARTGIDLSVSDCEILDGIEYHIFPNLVLWGGYAYPAPYRVRPYNDDPNTCLWEIMILAPLPEDTPLPRDVPMRMTASDEGWATAAELGSLGPLIDQDLTNLLKIQRGLHSDTFTHVTYSNEQERNIRNFHHHLEQLVNP